MARSVLLGVSSVGLFVGTLVLSFSGCYTDESLKKGECQPSAMPVDECTIAKCNADGTPAHEPVPNAENKVCFRGENEGVCVDGACALACETQMTPCKCANDDACPGDKQCVDWACDAGECKSTLKPDGMVVDTLVTGDCQKSVCQGGTPQVVADDEDVPLGEEVDGDCRKPACSNGTKTTDADDTDVPADTPEDCNLDSCMNGMPTKVPKGDDKPADTECTAYTCDNGTLKTGNADLGTACTGGFCDSNAMCIACFDKPTWDTCGGKNCAAKLCPKQACTANADCQNDMCIDGYCCNSLCTDECKSCGVAGKLGECTNIPYYQPDDKYTDSFNDPNATCSNTFVCNGMGKCLGRRGASCVDNAECLSAECSTGVNQCLGAKDESCTSNGQCASGTCTNNKCT